MYVKDYKIKYRNRFYISSRYYAANRENEQ